MECLCACAAAGPLPSERRIAGPAPTVTLPTRRRSFYAEPVRRISFSPLEVRVYIVKRVFAA